MRLQTRFILTHDTEENWNKCTNFIPNKAEMIVYDCDEKYNYPRVKIGDGKTTIVNLPFTLNITIEDILNTRNDVHYLDGGRIANK
jgi:hypothetical protein